MNVLIKNGKTRYKLLTPKMADGIEKFAAEELTEFFSKATGIRLETVTEVSAGEPPYLSVGKTELLEASGHEISRDLGVSGFKLFSDGENIFMAGAQSYGTLYAVYEFLRRVFNYEVFSKETIRIDKCVSDKELPRLDITDKPSFQYRSPSHAYTKRDTVMKNRFRLIDLEDIIKGDGSPYHNSFTYLPPEKYAKEHPKWYSSQEKADLEKGFGEGDGEVWRQLCYCAHGDQQEYQKMVETAALILRDVVKKYPKAPFIAFTHQDNQLWCTCPACEELKQKYGGAQSGIAVRFLNAVRAELQKWFDTSCGAKYDAGQRLVFFAYHSTNKPPAIYDGHTDTFKIADSDVVLKGVVPWFAETDADYTCPLTEGELNKRFALHLRGWRAISDEILFWTYGTNFFYQLTPYNSFGASQETYKFAYSQGAKMIFDQGQIIDGASTAWEELKGYLYYRTAWDVNVNRAELIDDYFNESYALGAEYMKKAFDSFLTLGAWQNKNGYSGTHSVHKHCLKEEWWPYETVREWLELMVKALEAVNELKNTEPERYNILYRNITLEIISPLYILTELHKTRLGENNLLKNRELLKKLIFDRGVTMFSEHKKIETLFKAWEDEKNPF